MDKSNTGSIKKAEIIKPGFTKDGKFAKGNQLGEKFTSASLPELVKIRVSKAQQLAAQALDDAAIDMSVILKDSSKLAEQYGWYAVIYHITKLVLTSRDPRGIAELVKIIGNATGYMGKDTSSKSDGDVTISSEVREFISNVADIVRAKEKGNE